MSVAMASLMQAEALMEAHPDRPWLHRLACSTLQQTATSSAHNS